MDHERIQPYMGIYRGCYCLKIKHPASIPIKHRVMDDFWHAPYILNRNVWTKQLQPAAVSR